MNGKGFLKYREEESKGAMHYITYKGDLLSLTNRDSRKARYIQKNHTLEVADGLKSDNFKEYKVEIIDDAELVNELCEFMKNENHTHYPNGCEGAVILKFLV